MWFERLIQKAFNPKYKSVSRTTTRNDLKKCFKTMCTRLINDIACLRGSISLTSDMWRAVSKQEYICVTSHYIDSNWRLQKIFIGFRAMYFEHTGENIFHTISSVMSDFNIMDCIISITLDNAASNAKAIQYFESNGIPQNGSYFFHQRCACHIINLMVKSGLKLVTSHIHRIQEALAWIIHSTPRIADFARSCLIANKNPRQFGIDMEVRWNSTYLMLQNCIDYSEVISLFYKT